MKRLGGIERPSISEGIELELSIGKAFYQQAARLSAFFRAVTCRGTGQHLQSIAPLETVSFFALTLDLEHFVDLWVGVP